MSGRHRIQLGILELDWPVDDPIHRWLPYPPPRRARGEHAASHALATAGVLLSRDPELPGLCPDADVVLTCPAADEPLAPALQRLAEQLEDGSILLVEATLLTEGPELPADADPAVRAVVEAHAERLILVLPAGNSGIDLGSLAPTAAWTVGACDREGAWLGSSNHGKRVQLHAAGHGIPSLSWGPTRVHYRDTSAAAAQIAGIALRAQRIAVEHLGVPLSPTELLARLQGSGSIPPRAGLDPWIGFRPDLRAFQRSLVEDSLRTPHAVHPM